jgi:CDP-diacylglycerol--glycerol-3-phosphate 3-phosphatidyltransferase
MQKSSETLTTKAKRAAQGIILPIVKFLDQIGVTPNLITWVGFAGSFLAAYLITLHRFQLAALILMIFSSMDAIDGSLARYQNKNSKYGAFLDSTLDRYAETVLFVGFLIYFINGQQQIGIIFSYLSITMSLIVSYTRARASDLGAESSAGFVTRMERYILIILMLIIQRPIACVIIIASLSLITGIQRFLIARKDLIENNN